MNAVANMIISQIPGSLKPLGGSIINRDIDQHFNRQLLSPEAEARAEVPV